LQKCCQIRPKPTTYRTIPTLQEYLLIDQTQRHVEQYVKQRAHQWLFTEFDDEAANLTLVSVNVEIALADLYESVAFYNCPCQV
jgi:Uma2 family endonuclease